VGSEIEGESDAVERTNLLHPTSVNAESTFNPLPSHRFLDALRRCPVREVVDFWEGPNPGPGSIEEVSASEEGVGSWGWEGGGLLINQATQPN
jgi:hypothetical protein